jgi:hypothetical protein
MPNDLFFNNLFESTPDRELEEQQIQEIADITVKLLNKRYATEKQVLRGVHAKSHGCVNATFEVLSGIDRCLRVGLFARPVTYNAVIRYSNAATLVAPDLNRGENGSRGMAIKIFAVDGKVLMEDNGRAVQDFLMINTPSFAFVNVGDYLRLNRILLKDNDVAGRFFAPLQAAQTNPPTEPEKLAELGRIGQSFGVLKQILATPVANPLEVAYFSGAPYLFAQDHCMHFSVVPQGEKKAQKIPKDPSDDYLRKALQKTMAGNEDVVYDFKVQVRKAGEPDLFIEDATQSWIDEQKYPRQTVARITIPAPQTGLDTPEHLEECEERVFTPWHALAEHQPLGSINRLRHAVYVASASHRRAQPC